MQDLTLIFLAIAVFIIGLAVFLSRAFKKSIARDKQLDDLNNDPRDGQANATWIGINKSVSSDD